MKGRDNMQPITTQAELDAILSDRLKRERAKICKSHADELKGIIDDLTELCERWKDAEAQNRRGNS